MTSVRCTLSSPCDSAFASVVQASAIRNVRIETTQYRTKSCPTPAASRNCQDHTRFITNATRAPEQKPAAVDIVDGSPNTSNVSAMVPKLTADATTEVMEYRMNRSNPGLRLKSDRMRFITADDTVAGTALFSAGTVKPLARSVSKRVYRKHIVSTCDVQVNR
jgi:hypothetical protein